MSDRFFTFNTGSGSVINDSKVEGNLVIQSSEQMVNELDFAKISKQLIELLSIDELSEIEKVIVNEAQVASKQCDKNKLKEKLELLAKSTLSFVRDVSVNILATMIMGKQ